MSKLVMLNEIRKEKKVVNLNNENNKSSDNYNEEYLNFENKFCNKKSESNIKNEFNNNDNSILINKEQLNHDLNRIFLLKNKKPFIDFINEVFDDYLGTNCSIYISKKYEDDEYKENGILKDPSNSIMISVEDDYRRFQYSIQFQTYDYENIAITVAKSDLNSSFRNVINLSSKIKEYKNNSEKASNTDKSDLYLIMVNSNIKVPDSYEVRQECNGSTVSYKFNIFKGWKYDFRDLYEKNLYMLFPLKIFDLKKCISYMEESSYSKDIIEKEIHRFYYEMNKYLNKVKENNSIDDNDIREINSISKDIMRDFGYYCKYI